MKICDSCGKIGGEHTPFCKYQNRDPEMLDVHDTHKVMGNGKCMWCDRSDVPGLVIECAKSPAKKDENPITVEQPPIFPIDSSHLTRLVEGVWTCGFCGGTDRNELEQPCPKAPENFNFAAVEVHPSHRIKWEDGKPVNCESCGVSDAVQLTEACPMSSPTGRLLSSRGFKPTRTKKGTVLSGDFVWVIYNYDHGPYAISIHSTPEDAIDKHTNLGGSHRIAQWPFGMELHEAVKKWEERDEH